MSEYKELYKELEKIPSISGKHLKVLQHLKDRNDFVFKVKLAEAKADYLKEISDMEAHIAHLEEKYARALNLIRKIRRQQIRRFK